MAGMGCAGGRENAILTHDHFSPRPVGVGTAATAIPHARTACARAAQPSPGDARPGSGGGAVAATRHGGGGGRRRRRAAAAAGGGGGDGGWWWSGPDGASRGSPAVLSRRLGGLEPARASVGPTRRRAEQRCDTACEPRSSRPPGRLLIRTPTTATERFGWFSTSPRASEKRIDAAS